MIVITYEQFKAVNPCSAKPFYDSPRYDANSNTLVYPDGWNDEEALRVGRKSITALQWLYMSKLLPITKEDFARYVKLLRSEASQDVR